MTYICSRCKEEVLTIVKLYANSSRIENLLIPDYINICEKCLTTNDLPHVALVIRTIENQ